MAERDRAAARWLRLARWAGAAPLCAGLAIFAGWFRARSESWVVAGVVLLWIGAVLATGGAVALWRYRHLARGVVAPAELRRRTGWTALLLVANVPAAFVLSSAAIAIESAWVVTVRNAGSDTLAGVRIVGGGVDEALDPLAPGERDRRRFWIDNDGTLELVVPGPPERRATLADYVTALLGGRAEVTIGPGDEITVVRPLEVAREAPR